MTGSDRSAAHAAPLTTAAMANSAAKDLRLRDRRVIEISIRNCIHTIAMAFEYLARTQRSAKLKRVVALPAERTDEVEHFEAEAGLASAKRLHRARVDQLTVAFEPNAVAVL